MNLTKELYTSYNKYFEGKNLYCNLTNVSSILCKTITKWREVATRVSVAITMSVCKQSWVGNVSRNHVTSLVVYICCHSTLKNLSNGRLHFGENDFFMTTYRVRINGDLLLYPQVRKNITLIC